MAADVKIQASVLRKNSNDYPQFLELEIATNAIATTLCVSGTAAQQTIVFNIDKHGT